MTIGLARDDPIIAISHREPPLSESLLYWKMMNDGVWTRYQFISSVCKPTCMGKKPFTLTLPGFVSLWTLPWTLQFGKSRIRCSRALWEIGGPHMSSIPMFNSKNVTILLVSIAFRRGLWAQLSFWMGHSRNSLIWMPWPSSLYVVICFSSAHLLPKPQLNRAWYISCCENQR